MTPACRIFPASMDPEVLLRIARALLPEGDFRRICIKPNWVMHAEHPEFPVEALITAPALIDAVITACLEQYPRAEWITVGDVPLQSCEWEKMAAQSGLDAVRKKFEGRTGPVIRFLDLRRERFIRQEGFLVPDPAPHDGDPLGYREVILDQASHLDEVSDARTSFRVSDYDPGLTTSNHRNGYHRYMIACSVLEADLFINLPKMKTHQKAGITGALKNLVGINGQKAFLVHHRKNVDEFGDLTPRLVRLQVRVRELLQKRSRGLFALARRAWLALKRFQGIQTEATREHLQSGKVYMAAGSWYGNDTIWRMVYDLNRIIRYAPAGGGRPSSTPQRAYVTILDGIMSGEGNGPLQPLPVVSNLVLGGADPFLIDSAMAHLMGFDIRKIPCLSRHRLFERGGWGDYDPAQVAVEFDGKVVHGLGQLPVVKDYLPPPGWKGHIERASGPPET